MTTDDKLRRLGSLVIVWIVASFGFATLTWSLPTNPERNALGSMPEIIAAFFTLTIFFGGGVLAGFLVADVIKALHNEK